MSHVTRNEPRSRGRSARQDRVIRTTLALVVVTMLLSPLTTGRVAGQASGGQTGEITGTDGVLLRAEPAFDAAVVTSLSPGTVVALRIDTVDTRLDPDGATRWWPVGVGGDEGWVAGYYLQTDVSDPALAGDPGAARPGDEVPDTSAGDPQAPSSTTIDDSAANDLPAGTTARVSDPDGVNLRAEPSTDAEVLDTLAPDTVVELRTDQADTVIDGDLRWWPVRIYGQDGWIAGSFLGSSGDTSGPGDTDTNSGDQPPASTATATFRAGQYVGTTADDGLNIRAAAGPDGERVGFIESGDVVQVMDGPIPGEDSANGWYLITTGEVTGYVDGDLLLAASQPPAPDPVEDRPAPERQAATFGRGDTVQPIDGDGINLRESASTASAVIETLDAGTRLRIVGDAAYDDEGIVWYAVTSGDLTGFAAGEFLVTASTDPAPEPAAPAPTAVPPPPTAGVATGSFMLPVLGYTFTQAYGCSPFAFEPYDGGLGCNFHNGIDLAANAYTPILASDGGSVKYAGWCDCGLGYYVEIDHGNGFATVYGHMAEMPYVATGQAVNQGEVIGPMGSTGLSTGPHVHFMLKVNGGTVDPLGYLG